MTAFRFDEGATSLINWLQATGQHDDILADCFRYDDKKTERLAELHELIGLPISHRDFIRGEEMSLANPTIQALQERLGGSRIQHAFRISPTEEHLGEFPVMKKYGITFTEFESIFWTLPVTPSRAIIRVTEFSDRLKNACVMLVTSEGILGEIAEDSLYHLTYARRMEEGKRFSQFWYAYDGSVGVHPYDAEVNTYAHDVMELVRAPSDEAFIKLEHNGYAAHHGFVEGYYELVQRMDGTWFFTDMNRKSLTMNLPVHQAIARLQAMHTPTNAYLHGLVAHAGEQRFYEGKVYLLTDGAVSNFPQGHILVCPLTTVETLPTMQKASAIITDQGGLTSHPAIVSRELGIPCIVGTKDATKRLRHGDTVRLDMRSGTVVCCVETTSSKTNIL